MMTRREAIRKVVILTIASLCAGLVGAAEAADFDWGRFKGKDVTLRMIDQKRTWSTLVGGWLPEFAAVTGIQVQLDVLPQEQYNQRIGGGGRVGGGADRRLHDPAGAGGNQAVPGGIRDARRRVPPQRQPHGARLRPRGFH